MFLCERRQSRYLPKKFPLKFFCFKFFFDFQFYYVLLPREQFLRIRLMTIPFVVVVAAVVASVAAAAVDVV